MPTQFCQIKGSPFVKKTLSLLLASVFLFTSIPFAFATAVTADRPNDGNDLTAGAVFDNVGAWTLTVADNADFTTGVITTAGNGGANAGTVTFAGSSIINTAVSADVLGTGANALLAVNAGVASETVTINGDVFATTFTVSGTGTVNTDSITGTTVNFAADGIISLDTNENITAAITNTTTNNGTLTLEGAHTITGDIGNTGVGLKLITVGNGAVVTTGDIKATTINYAGNNNLTIATGKNVTAAITNTTTNQGTLTLAGAHTITGDIGSTGVGLNLITVGNGAVVTTGDIKATTMNYAGNNSVTIADTKNFTGAITTSVDNQGTLNFAGTHSTGGLIGTALSKLAAVNIQNGTLTMDHNISATTVTVDSSAGGGTGTLTLSGNRTLTGDLTLANVGVLNLGANTLSETGIYTQGNGTTLNVSINSTSVFGHITATGNAAVSATSTLNLTVLNTYIPNGSTFKIIDGAGGAGVFVPGTITDNSFALSFTGASSGGDLTLTATLANPYSEVSEDANTSAVGKVLEEIGTTTTDSDMQHVLSVINSLSSAKEIEAALETLQPDLSSGDLQGTRTLSGQFHSTVSNRLSYARGGLSSGIATGDMVQGAGFWVQGVGSHSSQGEREGIEGYNANTFGTTMGFDKLYGNRFRAGLAGGYGFGSIDSKTPGSPSTDVHSFQGTLYSSFESAGMMSVRKKREVAEAESERSQQEKLWYMDSMLSFMQNKYDSRRDISLGNESRIARADHYGQQYSTKFEAGYTFTFDKTKALEITPFTSLGYSYLYMNQYKERGADSLNLTVAGQGYHQLEQGLGIKFGYPIPTKNGQVYIPSIRGSWLYDYIGSRFKTSAAFQGGGPAFETFGAEPAQSAFLVGAELAFLNKGNLTLTGNFDWELRDAYSGLTYYATLRYDF